MTSVTRQAWVQDGWIPSPPTSGGNFVTIQHAEEEYSFLAHLIPGSVRVAVGQRVSEGQEIGHCGNSGHSTEPHLHFHLQDRADFFEAAGLPIAFDEVSIGGMPPASKRYLRRNARVRRA